VYHSVYNPNYDYNNIICYMSIILNSLMNEYISNVLN
jgi:hypothetical protein